MKRFLQSWAINTLAVLVAAYVVTGIHYEKPLDLFVASLVLGIFNAFFRPVLMFLALPLLVFTLGLFTLVINAVMLWLTSAASSVLGLGFHVAGFVPAFLGALVISIVSIVGTKASRSTLKS